MQEPSVAELVARALDAHASLVSVAEAVEDEWQYVTDLSAVWRGRLGAVAAARGAGPAPPFAALAVETAAAEIGLIADPHRAIDWLSTFPQVVLAAIGEGT